MSDINKLSLTFDEKALYNDLIEAMVKKLFDVSRELMTSFQSYASDTISPYFHFVIETGVNEIVSYVGNYHWYAFIDNFGSGSLMETDVTKNPWLVDYIYSGQFNKARLYEGMAVLARPEGEYIVPDFTIGHGNIVREGSGATDEAGKPLNMEKSLNPKTGTPLFTPIPAKHWLHNRMQEFEKRFQDELQKTYNDFPFYSDKYLKGGFD